MLWLVTGCSAGGVAGDAGGVDTHEPMVGGATGATGPDASSDASSQTTSMPTDTQTGDVGEDGSTTEDVDATDTSAVSGCQDGIVDPGEQCDDGNDVNADGCNRDCRFSGQLVWQRTVGTGFGAVDQGDGIAPEVDGSVWVSGYVSANADGGRDGWLARYDATGRMIWEVTLSGPGGTNDEIRGLVSDGVGNVYAAGYRSGPKGQALDAWLARYDSAGTQAWVQHYNGVESRNDVYDALTLDAEGNVVVGGFTQSLVTGNDVFLRKVSSAGDVLWSRTFDGPSGGFDLLRDVEVSPAGHIYVAGYEAGPTAEARNAWLAKFDGDGNEIWSRSFNGPESLDDQLNGLSVIGEDEVVVCGFESGTAYPSHSIVRRYDALGMIVWTDRYAGGTSEGAHCNGLKTDVDQNLVMTGGEARNGVQDVLVRKYDPQGQERWTALIPGGAAGPDYGRDVAIGLDGEIWIAGAIDTGADARDVWIGEFTP